MSLTWKSPLVVHEFDLAEAFAAIGQGRIPDDADLSRPWVELAAPLSLESERLGMQTIPAGFVYDQASLPRQVWWWMSPSDPRINRAACWHDFLSPWPGTRPPWFDVVIAPGIVANQWLSSSDAANELYDGMRASGANAFDASVCARAVKTFGPKF